MSYKEFYQKSMADPVAFWREQAEAISWFRSPQKVLKQDRHGLWRWFPDGMMNTSFLALDHHVQEGRGDQTALIYDSPVTHTKERYTYRQLLDETAHFAGVLQRMGVKKGDRVIIYMSLVPEVVVAMLACARLGAVHSVVFGGFAAHELALRIDDAKPKLILTASAGIEFEKIIPYQPVLEKALKEAKHRVKTCIVLQRSFLPWNLKSGRDYDWKALRQQATPADPVPVRATDPLYILYTSGTTGKPKGIVRDNGGHAVALRFSMKNIYDTHPGEVYWAASDVGWVVGHSYIVYAPLITGCTTILYEGKPVRTPDAGAFWRVISEYGVKTFFTAPTAFRAVRKEDPEGLFKARYDISSLKYQFLAGERCDAATLQWAIDLLGIPVIDHWWQTESGYPMLANPAGIELFPVKPGSAGKPVPGFDIQVLDENGQPQPPGAEGAVCIRLPLPPGCLPSLWKAPERFKDSYLSAFPGYYFTGDGGYMDEEGHTFITGRIDDVINVSGHRLSTADMEEIVATHPAVAECAVVGVEDALKGQVPVGFVVLKAGTDISEGQVQADLSAMVRDQLGAIACFKQAVVTKRLPKTRSGKILRKVMRNIADRKPYSPPGTIEDMSVLDEMETLMDEKHIGAWEQDKKS